MAIEWDHLTQPRFDRMVEALVHRLYVEDAEVEVMNGRGGDGGIDIKVTVDSRVWIYQLKYFPDGFPGSYQGRRTGIKRSFKKALEHDPDDWVLVVPCALTPAERAQVDHQDCRVVSAAPVISGGQSSEGTSPPRRSLRVNVLAAHVRVGDEAGILDG